MKMEQHINKINKREGDDKEKIAEQPKTESENYRKKDEKELIEMSTEAQGKIHEEIEDLTLTSSRNKEKIRDYWKILEFNTLRKSFEETGLLTKEESEGIRRHRKGMNEHYYERPEGDIMLYDIEAQKAALGVAEQSRNPEKVKLLDRLGEVERDALKVMEEIAEYRSVPAHKFFESLGNEIDNIKIERMAKEKGIKLYDEFLGEGPRPGMKSLLEHIKQGNQESEIDLWKFLNKEIAESGSEDILKQEPEEVQDWYKWVKERIDQERPIEDVINKETSGRIKHAHLVEKNEKPEVVKAGKIMRRAYLNGIGDKNKAETALRNVGEF